MILNVRRIVKVPAKLITRDSYCHRQRWSTVYASIWWQKLNINAFKSSFYQFWIWASQIIANFSFESNLKMVMWPSSDTWPFFYFDSEKGHCPMWSTSMMTHYQVADCERHGITMFRKMCQIWFSLNKMSCSSQLVVFRRNFANSRKIY